MAIELTLTPSPIRPEKQDKPPSLATDDRFAIRLCTRCQHYYRLDGFPLGDLQLTAAQAFNRQTEIVGKALTGVCPGCSQ